MKAILWFAGEGAVGMLCLIVAAVLAVASPAWLPGLAVPLLVLAGASGALSACIGLFVVVQHLSRKLERVERVQDQAESIVESLFRHLDE